MGEKPAHLEQWQRCLEIIACNVKEQEFKAWFQPTDFVSYDAESQELLLAIPSNYFYEILDGQFKLLIYNIVRRVFGKSTRIKYRILTDSTNGISTEVVGLSTQEKMRKTKDDMLRPVSKPADDLDTQLNPEYRFENFIEGESNRFPYSIGKSIAENPKQTTFNPFFLHGSTGVGKTHLVNAIGLAIKEKYPKRRVLYVTAHQFMVQYTQSIRDNKFNDFISFYQTIDTLIIDDVQEMSGQAATQLAFYHIFNHLKMNGKQIILTSDQNPSVMQGMEERLLTRFKWGLTAELEKPNFDLCRRILLSKVHRDGLTISEDVIDYIAANANDSVRDLEGIVNSLMAYTIVYNRDIDLAMAEQIIRRNMKRQVRTVTIDDILKSVCSHWKVSQEDVFSKSRKANIVLVRQTAMYLAQVHTKLTNSKIGMFIGGRNHATVIHAIQQIKDRIDTNKDFADEVCDIEKKLGCGSSR